jgi:hypothetical protein
MHLTRKDVLWLRDVTSQPQTPIDAISYILERVPALCDLALKALPEPETPPYGARFTGLRNNEALMELLATGNCWLSGGALVRTVLGFPLDAVDLDVYTRDYAQGKVVLQKHGYYILKNKRERSSGIGECDQWGRTGHRPIDLIGMYHHFDDYGRAGPVMSIEEQIARHDIVMTQVAWDGTTLLFGSPDTWEHLTERRVEVVKEYRRKTTDARVAKYTRLLEEYG